MFVMYSMICRYIRDYSIQPDDTTAPWAEEDDPVIFYFVEGCRATRALIKFLRSRQFYRSALVGHVCAVNRDELQQIPFTNYAPGPYM